MDSDAEPQHQVPALYMAIPNLSYHRVLSAVLLLCNEELHHFYFLKPLHNLGSNQLPKYIFMDVLQALRGSWRGSSPFISILLAFAVYKLSGGRRKSGNMVTDCTFSSAITPQTPRACIALQIPPIPLPYLSSPHLTWNSTWREISLKCFHFCLPPSHFGC